MENNSGEKFAIVDLMDGTLSDLIKDKLTITQAIEITLDMDSILDRINDVGVDGLTLEEKDFLDKQN